MKIKSIFTGLSVISFAAGSIASWACWQGSLVVSGAILLAALLLAGIASAAAMWKLRNGTRSILQQVATSETQTEGELNETGISELDELGRQFIKSLKQAQTSSHAETQQLQEITRLLAKVDRRDDSLDRNGLPVTVAARLRAILQGYGNELDSNVRQAVACGREIRRATEEIVTGSEVQSDSVDQTTAVVEQLSQHIISVCDHSEHALQVSTETRDTANTRLVEFQELIEDLKQIRNQAVARERKLQSLGQHTKEIETIVQAIGTLSSRTDLLALNASIESVRAGEHGRGFAIVAEEVRALAEQSAQAAVDITTRIELIQLETHQSLSVASEEHDQLQQVIQRTSLTFEALQEICSSAELSTTRLNDISDSSNQQLRLAQEIVASLERENSVCKKNRSRAEGVHWTSKTLVQVGANLDSALELYRRLGILTHEPAVATGGLSDPLSDPLSDTSSDPLAEASPISV